MVRGSTPRLGPARMSGEANGAMPPQQPRYPNNIKVLQRQKGWAPKKVADAAGINIATYYGLQRGRLPLTQERAQALAQVLECTVAELAGSTTPLPTTEQLRRRHDKPAITDAAVLKRQLNNADLKKLIEAALQVPEGKRGAAVNLLRSFIEALD